MVTDDYPEIGLPDPYEEARKHFPNHLGGAYWTSGPGNRVVLKVTEVGPNNEEVTIEVPYEVFCITIPSRMFNIGRIDIFTDDKEVDHVHRLCKTQRPRGTEESGGDLLQLSRRLRLRVLDE